MQLFIANTSKQHHDFTYRIPGEANCRMERIKSGEQARLAINETADIVAKIVEQHVPYGLVDSSKLSSLKDFCGICYSLDRPVQLENMLVLFEHNDEVLNDRAEERREQSAAAIAEGIQSSMAQHGVTVPRTEVEFTEETQRGMQPSLATGFEVVAQGVSPRHGGKRSKKRTARR